MTKIKLYNFHTGTVYVGRFPANLEFSSAAKRGWKSPTQFKKAYPQFADNYKDVAIEIKIPPLGNKVTEEEINKLNRLNAIVLNTLNQSG